MTGDLAEVEQFSEELVSHARATGRKPREILQSMRDDGYIACDDEGFEECVRRTELKLKTSKQNGEI